MLSFRFDGPLESLDQVLFMLLPLVLLPLLVLLHFLLLHLVLLLSVILLLHLLLQPLFHCSSGCLCWL